MLILLLAYVYTEVGYTPDFDDLPPCGYDPSLPECGSIFKTPQTPD